ncbi:hypothetical protein N7501_002100 [Penicillium viridicatum]|nr:hypothetical protein N7501_002100 [Penicillium viridicatum]
MDIQRQFPSVHWIWGGGISFVYEVYLRIVVKVPKSGEFVREQFQKELEIYQVFSQHPPCPSIIQCFLFSSSSIFLEYIRVDYSGYFSRKVRTSAPTKRIDKQSRLSCRFLRVGQPRLYFEIYRDRYLADDPYNYSPKYNKYIIVSELAVYTKTPLNERTDTIENNKNRKKKSSKVTTLVKTPLRTICGGGCYYRVSTAKQQSPGEPVATIVMWIKTAWKRTFFRKRNFVRTWRNVVFFTRFLQASLSKLDSLLIGIGIVFKVELPYKLHRNLCE